MKINGIHYQTIWETDELPSSVSIIDQRWLPHKLSVVHLKDFEDFLFAIKEMLVRGAQLIGVTTAYALYFAVRSASKTNFQEAFQKAKLSLAKTRPTAVNLINVIKDCERQIEKIEDVESKKSKLLMLARETRQKDIEVCRKIGEFGAKILGQIYEKKKETVNVLTHCNAGWLATIDYGTALAPIYVAREQGIPIHVWVDETRPWLQGSRLTAFELLQEGIPHTIISDNTGGLLMLKGLVDIVIVGTDRTTRKGDVANKIGTYLKALAAFENGIPFYVALPSSSIDWKIENALLEIPLEIRSEKEVKYVSGLLNNEIVEVLISPMDSPALNYAFDITPSKFVTGFITERGICPASEEGLLSLFPEAKNYYG